MSRAFMRGSELIRQGILSQIILSGSGVFSLCCYAKNSVLLPYYKNSIELHGNQSRRKPIEPSDKLKNLVSQVTKDLEDNISEHTPIVPFLIPGLNTMHSGTVGTSAGGIIGLPVFFEFNSKYDLDNNVMVHNADNYSSNTEDEDIYDCVLLSDKAKKYAIAREILLINTYKVYINMPLPLLVAVFVDTVTKVVAVGLSKYPVPMRGLFYVSVTIVGLALWKALYKQVTNYHESEVQFQITKLGREYIEGGVEYVSKEIQRKSLNVQLKDQKNRIVNILRNNLCLLISSTEIPLVLKRAYLEGYLSYANEEKVQ